MIDETASEAVDGERASERAPGPEITVSAVGRVGRPTEVEIGEIH